MDQMNAKDTDKTGAAPRSASERRSRRFVPASALVRTPVRKAAESHGFAVTKLLTHWDEVAGPDLAPLCRPERISYGKGGFGATLRLLASGAAAPLVQMQLMALKERIKDNARVRIEPEDMRRLCEFPDRSTLLGVRDAALLATLAGSGLRVSELASLFRYWQRHPLASRDLPAPSPASCAGSWAAA